MGKFDQRAFDVKCREVLYKIIERMEEGKFTTFENGLVAGDPWNHVHLDCNTNTHDDKECIIEQLHELLCDEPRSKGYCGSLRENK